jgi:NADH-quinone oxidoreductase subunit E
MELTPAHVEAVATFYDMYNLEPVGRHMVEVCTNLSCALVGAKRVVDAFQEQLGIPPGETSDDGEVTLRLVECAGGCGFAPVVIVDGRYREPTKPEDVPAIIEGLRGS